MLHLTLESYLDSIIQNDHGTCPNCGAVLLSTSDSWDSHAEGVPEGMCICCWFHVMEDFSVLDTEFLPNYAKGRKVIFSGGKPECEAFVAQHKPA